MKRLSKLVLSACFILTCGISSQVQAADLDEVIVNADKYKTDTSQVKTYAGGYLSENTSLGLQKDKDMMELPASTMTITDKAIKDFAISGNNEIMKSWISCLSIHLSVEPRVLMWWRSGGNIRRPAR